VGLSIAAGVSAIAFAGYLISDILKQETGTARMREISEAIQKGAMAYLNRQYKSIAVFAVILACVLALALGPLTAVTFILGAILSATAGYIGMNIAIRANVRTAQMAKSGLGRALKISFNGGMVMGMSVTGIGLLGVCILYWLIGDPNQIVGFGFGTALIALFARVGGGIYTKAADMGADLVGKVEVGIPEDDPRNPAVIADLVGDNVGDVAGMGADVFESYVCTLIASMLIGSITYGIPGIVFPLIVQAAGIISSIFVTFLVEMRSQRPSESIKKGMFTTGLIVTATSCFLSWMFFKDLRVFYATLSGIVAIILFALITEHYTSYDRSPVKAIAEASKTGSATNILLGIATGFESTAFPVIVIGSAILLAYLSAGLYGIAVSAIGFLSITTMIVAMDSYGPIVDNASGIVEMVQLDPEVRKVTDALDSLGNTTKAICKSFAIGAAAFAAIALFAAYVEETGLMAINIAKPSVSIGVFIGGMLSFLFCSFLIKAVGNAAFQMIEEVRRQFREIRGLMTGETKPDYARCVDISTRSALRGLIIPGVLSITVPIVVGFTLGAEAVAGLFLGTIASGLPLALFLAHSGTAWDNAKKYVEAGHLGGKGTEVHAATVVGDTVGDPFKDTAGPSLNILMDIIGTVALLLATSFIAYALFV